MRYDAKLITFLIALSGIPFGVNQALAAPQHNCDNYASFAVSDAFK